ncbi:hypothetical protein J8M97_02600 [Gordonia polyisoprenivorans]|uniref:hypothetical protein n=1 Tax=Gordonia polyisoprenivorans TaxID=84595 RepID=UPI001A0A6133|nr:hypothetical protein [Gordonia polyisoprenivorans]MBE7191118.1 aldolase [Gordonia polyisoprenivorans]QUD83590.1 hypothetical protein J8M97_02600 [Gordonia polyisoprenivorans]UZF55448.1 hypothetical protein LH935_22490 [Gordonia polyisoprenivorans]
MTHAPVPTPAPVATPVDAFRDDHGLFSMVAVDQRGSLRHMLAAGADPATVTDDDLIDFKAAVGEAIGGTASGLLLDREYGGAAAQASSCPIILAADILSASVPGGPVDLAEIDPAVTADTVEQFGASALKMLVPWQPAHRSRAVDLTHAFMDRCRELGLPGVVEGVVRPRDGDLQSSEGFADALITAAADLAVTGPDLYKTEVVYTGPQDTPLTVATARAITGLLSCPWVVLSSGVSATDFPAAAAAAVTGGAQGFLAGRAVWIDATTAPDSRAHLHTHAVANLHAITTQVWKAAS